MIKSEYDAWLAELEELGRQIQQAGIMPQPPRNTTRDQFLAHKAPTVRNWLLKRPHWHVHHTPTSASWLNQVERFFALLTDRQLRRGVHRSLASLHDAITAFIDQHNADPKPFRWTKSADDILASIERFCHRITPCDADQRTYESGH